MVLRPLQSLISGSDKGEFTRLIYSSHTSRHIDSNDIEKIVQSARRYNFRHDITGMLCYGDGRFMQYIEGRKFRINNLYLKILQDDRHKDILLLKYEQASQRCFADWSMGYINLFESDCMDIITEVSGLDRFTPELLDEKQSLELIWQLKKKLKSQITIPPRREFSDLAESF